MASKLAVYDTGYEDERFQQVVSQILHCVICTNVIKDPVMCRRNEHIFCHACIARYLKNSQTCPTCMEPLTVDTLSQAPRTVTNLLAELKIRCEFFDRGCGQFIKLGDLEKHVRECGFAPAVCSNEGCRLEVNKRNLLHHESAVCELRRVKCHSCNDIGQEMDIVKLNLAAMNEKLDRNEKKLEGIETNGKVVQEQLNKQEESNRRIEADNVEMKKSLNEIRKQLERITQEKSHEVQVEQEQMKKGIAEADGMDTEPKVVIAGGWNKGGRLNSVEMFSLLNETWTPLQLMKERRNKASSGSYNNQIFVLGGDTDTSSKSMEKLSMNDVQDDPSITWEKFHDNLPGRLYGHCSVIYKGRLIVIGGYDYDKGGFSDQITDVSLVPPYTSCHLATMPRKVAYHGVALLDEEIVIVGGSDHHNSFLANVLKYNIAANECKELKQLPYSVYQMATVKRDDDNVIIMGGADDSNKALDKVLMYNVKDEKISELPDMRYKRKGCVAAVVRDTVIVMGGRDEKQNDLKSVESFSFDSYVWKTLPYMHEARYWATAAVW